MKTRRRNTLFGIAAIVLGVLLLVPVLGGVTMRHQMMEQMHAEGVEISAENETLQHHHADMRGHRGRGGGLFHMLGGLIRLVALGGAAYLLYRFFQQRRNGATPNNVEDDIRVGDDIDGEPAAQTTINPEEMSVDDLVAAMKRLGIKKLEL